MTRTWDTGKFNLSLNVSDFATEKKTNICFRVVVRTVRMPGIASCLLGSRYGIWSATMAFGISNVLCYGMSGDPATSPPLDVKFRVSSFDSRQYIANARFAKMHPNLFKVIGTDLDQLSTISIDGASMTFNIVNLKLVDNQTLFVWCVGWVNAAKSLQDVTKPIRSELTVTISTSENGVPCPHTFGLSVVVYGP